MLATLLALALPTPPLGSPAAGVAGAPSVASNVTDPWVDATVVSCPR